MNNQTQKKTIKEMKELARKVGHVNLQTTTRVYLHASKEIGIKAKEGFGQNINTSSAKASEN